MIHLALLTGFATDGEVSRQRAYLEDYLLSTNIPYDILTFKVLQYNPPQTLPFLRRNEISVQVEYHSVEAAAGSSSSAGGISDESISSESVAGATESSSSSASVVSSSIHHETDVPSATIFVSSPEAGD